MMPSAMVTGFIIIQEMNVGLNVGVIENLFKSIV